MNVQHQKVLRVQFMTPMIPRITITINVYLCRVAISFLDGMAMESAISGGENMEAIRGYGRWETWYCSWSL